MLSDFTLTPILAAPLFVLAVWCGHRYRQVWKSNGPKWQLWLFGSGAGSILLLLALVPIAAT